MLAIKVHQESYNGRAFPAENKFSDLQRPCYTAICYTTISRSRNQETTTAKLKSGRKDRSTSLPMFKKIDHINIVVSDLEAAKEFFLDLGFTVVKREMLEGEWLDKVVNLPSAKAE